MVQRSGGRKADRAGTHGLTSQLAHLRNVQGRGRFTSCTAIAHDIQTQRTVRQLGTDINVVGMPFQCREVFGEALPLPVEAFVQRHARNVLDTFHEFDQPIVIMGPDWREANAAVPHHDGGDAMRTARLKPAVPHRLAVIVRMNVDESWRDQQAAGINLFASRPMHRADFHNAALVDRDVGFEKRRAQAIGDGASTNHQIHLLHSLVSMSRMCTYSTVSMLRMPRDS
ncbi:hypothetical protein D3C72_1683650 [compost metagenome]